MRRVSYILALCLMASPAARADEQQDLKDYGDALKLFGAGKVAIADYFAAAPKQVLAGIEGRWGLLSLMGMGVTEATPEALDKACKFANWTVSAKDSFGFSMLHQGATNSYSVTYVSAGGNGFVFTSDIPTKLRYLGLDASDNPSDGQAAVRFPAIRSASGQAMVYRPSADILVIQSFATPPNVYIRCP